MLNNGIRERGRRVLRQVGFEPTAPSMQRLALDLLANSCQLLLYITRVLDF